MSDIKRIDPRRPYRRTPEDLRRIVLGETGPGGSLPPVHETGHQPQQKAPRLRQETDQWFMAVAHSDRGRLDGHARQAIAAAAILATPNTGVVAVVLGDLNEDAASLGADRVVVLPDFDAARFQPEHEMTAVGALIRAFDARHVFIPDRSDGDGDLGRRLIAAHGDTAAAHVVEVDANHVSVPWSRGASFAQTALPRFILLEAGAVDINLPFIGMAERANQADEPNASQDAELCRDLGLEDTDPSSIALEEADFVVSAGNGVGNVQTLKDLARALGAAVGASRVAVDDGKFPRDQQIGATGKTVSASAYIAIGISGAVQHLQGIKDCRLVIAINRDASAPIVKRADLTVIGDAEEVMQAMLAGLERRRNPGTAPEAA